MLTTRKRAAVPLCYLPLVWLLTIGTAAADSRQDTQVSGGWMAQVQDEIRSSEYHVNWQHDTQIPDLPVAYHAPNRAQNLRTYFTESGIRVVPRSFSQETWEWGLALVGYGSADDLLPAGKAEVSAAGNRIELLREGLVEWYVNDERGLEQGFTLAENPSPWGGNTAPLRFDLALSGNLRPQLFPDGQSIEFYNRSGVAVLRYGSLHVWDATGRVLPARFAVGRRQPVETVVSILVDVSEAIYPVTIDPLATAASWAVVGSQDGAKVGFWVGTAGDLNDDGYSDIVVGAPFFDTGQYDEGRAYVFHGSPTGPGTTATATFDGNAINSHLGVVVGTAGDVNNDGYDDLVLSAGTTVYVHHGSAAGASASANWSASGSTGAAAGDVNNDGYADVIVGDTVNSRARVFHGSASGLNAVAAWTVTASVGFTFFGWAAGTAGDVNNDGYDDVIVGAYFHSNGQSQEGSASVYHGSPTGLSTTAAWTVESNIAYAQFGYAVATAGDINDDGYSDVIVGSTAAGSYVYHGSASGLSTSAAWSRSGGGYSVAPAGDVNGDGIDDVIVGNPGNNSAAVFSGSAAGLSASASWITSVNNTFYGNAVGPAGDVDNDGYDDVLVGATAEGPDLGKAYLYKGSASGLGAGATWTAESDQESARLGVAVGAAGDVNNDGYFDVIVGSPFFDNGQADEGRIFLYHGSSSGLSTTANATRESNQQAAKFGTVVGSAGDVNNDGYDDVIVGAFCFTNGQTCEGRAFVYHGSSGGISSTANWTAESNQAWASFGLAVGAAGDVNNDGYGDVIVGAPDYDNGEDGEGRAYVFHGSASGLNLFSANWIAEGNQLGASFGSAVGTAGRVNADAYAEVIVGAPGYDNGQTNEGRAFLFHGSSTGLAASANWTAESNQAVAGFGFSVSTGGDVNGDGYADIVVGAPYFSNGQTNEGRAYVYLGSSTGAAATAHRMLESNQAGAFFGLAVSTAGDVNGDGYADVVVGASHYDNGQVDEGGAFVFHGSSDGLASAANRTLESNQGSALFGKSVCTAGDVNNDGFDDVIIGAENYDNGQSNEGRAFVYHGSW